MGWSRPRLSRRARIGKLSQDPVQCPSLRQGLSHGTADLFLSRAPVYLAAMSRRKALPRRFLVCLLRPFAAVLLFAATLMAQAPAVQPQYAQEHFTRQEVMIPVRDGVHLQTVIFTPKHQTSALPILLLRTPYGVPEHEKALDSGRYDDLIADGYIFVTQNIRGRFKSEGQFVMQRPVRDKGNPKSVDEGTDAYDTIDWLVKNVPNNNGRVGMWGISYPGWLVTQALLDPHPALKAASEQASPDDM